MAQVSLSELKQRQLPAAPVEASFFNSEGFNLIQRVATLFSNSTMVPEAYRVMIKDKKTGEVIKNENALPNCVVALNMAHRIGADPLMVMQNLYVVEGRPAWSSQFIISAINASGKFSPLRFDVEDLGEKDFEYTTSEWRSVDGRRQKVDVPHKTRIHDMSCIAWAKEKATGDRLDSPKITISMAVAEGWYGKNGSKWQTMPEMMLRYRAASFFGRLYAPELLMGIQAEEEARDIIDIEPAPVEDKPVMTTSEVKEKTRRRKKDPEPVQEVEVEPVEEATGDNLSPTEPESAPAEEAPAPKKERTWVECPDRDNVAVGVEYCNQKCPKRNGCPAF